jgi:hypothetical protein
VVPVPLSIRGVHAPGIRSVPSALRRIPLKKRMTLYFISMRIKKEPESGFKPVGYKSL